MSIDQRLPMWNHMLHKKLIIAMNNAWAHSHRQSPTQWVYSLSQVQMLSPGQVGDDSDCKPDLPVCVEAAAACQTEVRKMIHCRIHVNVLNDGSGFFLLLIHPCIQLVGCVT